MVLAVTAPFAHAQSPVVAPSAKAASKPAVAGAAAIANKAPSSASPVGVGSGPLWKNLTAQQHTALKPLATNWNTLSARQKRKWIALSENFQKLPSPEQSKLHSRMTEWVALSPQERRLARLNFAETSHLAPTEKKALWEEYQALTAAQKRALASGTTGRSVGVAPAVKPASAPRLAVVPKPKADGKSSPRIAAGPDVVDGNTLLPQSPPGSEDTRTP